MVLPCCCNLLQCGLYRQTQKLSCVMKVLHGNERTCIKCSHASGVSLKYIDVCELYLSLMNTDACIIGRLNGTIPLLSACGSPGQYVGHSGSTRGIKQTGTTTIWSAMIQAPLYKHAALGGQTSRQAVPLLPLIPLLPLLALLPLYCLPCSSTGMESPMGHSSSWHCPAIKPLAMALHSSKLPLPTTVPAGAARLYPTGRHGSRAASPKHPKANAFGKRESMVAPEQNKGII